MYDLSASLGLVQLDKLKHTNEMRRRLLLRYREAFADVEGVEMLAEEDYADSSCHNAVIKVAADRRDQLYAYLHRRGIDSNVHYHPNHMFPLYKLFTTRLQVTEREWERILTIPLFPDLSDEEQDRVIDLQPDSVGGYAADHDLASGQWLVTVTALKDGKRIYSDVQRVLVRKAERDG